MKTILIVAGLALAALAGPALAQSAPAAPAATTAGSDAASVEKTPIEALAADPAKKAVLEKHLPGITSHQAYDMFKSMSLKEVQPMSQGAITDAALTAIQDDLNKLGK